MAMMETESSVLKGRFAAEQGSTFGTKIVVPRSDIRKSSSSCMPYPWPMMDVDPTLNNALEIAMGYLEGSGLAYPYSEKQRRAADAILAAWQSGVRHQLRLANSAISAIEQKPASAGTEPVSFYPRMS
jgi:hypothetical protein